MVSLKDGGFLLPVVPYSSSSDNDDIFHPRHERQKRKSNGL